LIGSGKEYPPVPRPQLSSAVFQGPLSMMIANLFLGFVPILVRVSGGLDVPSTQIVFIRFVIGSLGVAAVVLLGLQSLELHERKLLFLRGAFGGLSVLFYFFAIQATSAGKGSLLNYTHSLWANIFAVVLFAAVPPRGFWWLLGLAGVGLWLVLDPNFQTINWGDALGLASGMMGGAAILSLKNLRKNTNSLTIFASFSIFGLLFSLVPPLMGKVSAGAGATWIWPPSAAWGALLGVGLLGMAGQLFFTFGYGYTSIPLGTVMSLSVPAIAAVGGWALLGEPLTPNFLLGATLILTAVGVLQYREAVERVATNLEELKGAEAAVVHDKDPSPEDFTPE
jgi:drug/metabolite transporter (DMT)-like permease